MAVANVLQSGLDLTLAKVLSMRDWCSGLHVLHLNPLSERVLARSAEEKKDGLLGWEKIGIKEHVILNKRGNSSTKRISGIKADALIDRVESTPVLEFNLIN